MGLMSAIGTEMYVTHDLSFQDQLHSLNPYTKKKKNKKKGYTRLQPVYCQLIALTSNILSLAKSLIRISTVMLTPCLSFSISRRPPAFLVSY